MQKSIYRQPLLTLLACAVVGGLAARGTFNQIANFPLIFAGICLVGGAWEIWKLRPRSAVMGRSAVLLVAGLLVVAGWLYNQRTVSRNLEQRGQVARARMLGTEASAIDGFEALNVSQTELDQAVSLTGNITIVTFWARWCSPCWKEMAELEILYQEHKDRGLKIVALTRYDTPADPAKRVSDTKKAKSFLNRRRFSFPAAIGTGKNTYADYAVHSIPATALIDRDGMILDYALSLSRARALMEKAVGLL